LDAVQGDAHNTLAALRELFADLQDGVSFTLEHTGEGTIWDFLRGKIKTLPLKVIVDPSDDRK
jgi:hypothetical protein